MRRFLCGYMVFFVFYFLLLGMICIGFYFLGIVKFNYILILYYMNIVKYRFSKYVYNEFMFLFLKCIINFIDIL